MRILRVQFGLTDEKSTIEAVCGPNIVPGFENYYKHLRNLTTSAIRSEKTAYLNYKLRITNTKKIGLN